MYVNLLIIKQESEENFAVFDTGIEINHMCKNTQTGYNTTLGQHFE
jgi:hypothetical protein